MQNADLTKKVEHNKFKKYKKNLKVYMKIEKQL